MEFCDLTITQAHQGLKKKEFSCLELIKSCLSRIDTVEKKLNAFITLTDKLALEQAKEIDKKVNSGQNIGYLEGIPVGIKDIFCTKGIETTAASNILRGFIPPYNATVVQRLKDAGVVILGKLNHDAFAHGSSGENSDFGITHNPWDLERVPGGSSSGSGAAVAAGECLFATGTDTGGSIRTPAAFCNLVGLKPTYGRVSRYGVIAMASSLDCPGVLTKTVEDQALVLQVIAGDDPFDSTTPRVGVPDYFKSLTQKPKKIKIGIPKEFFIKGIEQEVEALTRDAIKAFEGQGAEVIDISLPHTKFGVATYYILCLSEVSSNLARYDGIKFGFSDQSTDNLLGVYLNSRGKGFGDEAKRRIMLGTYSLSTGYYEAYYDKAQRVRRLIKQDFDQAFERVDVILVPTSPTPPFKLGEKVDDPLQMYLMDIFTATVNLAGIPSLNLPGGFVNGLPVGFQIIGPQFSEDLLLRIGYQYQQVTDWHKRKPKLTQT